MKCDKCGADDKGAPSYKTPCVIEADELRRQLSEAREALRAVMATCDRECAGCGAWHIARAALRSTDAPADEEWRKCPVCTEETDLKHWTCPCCGMDSFRKEMVAAPAPAPEAARKCEWCGGVGYRISPVNGAASDCPGCGGRGTGTAGGAERARRTRRHHD